MEILDVLAQIDTHLHQQDLYMKQQDERLGRQDRILELQTEQIRLMQLSLQKQDQILERLAVMIDAAREEAVATRQMQTLTMQRFTDTRLDVDRFITTAERVLAAWERQKP